MTADQGRPSSSWEPEETGDPEVLRELVEQLDERAEAAETEYAYAYEAWRCHLVGVCIGGDDRFYTLCEDCLHREGPHDDELEAERVALHHRWDTRGQRGRRG